MHYEGYPKCCGIAIIQDLGGSGEWWDSDDKQSEDDFLDTFKEASNIEYQYSMVLVALNAKQLKFYSNVLQRCGFEELNSRRNLKSGRNIYLFCWTRPIRSS